VPHASNQIPLFADPNAPSPKYVKHSRTSVNAAVSVRGKAASIRERVFAYIAAFGPATDEQIQDALDLSGNTQRARRVELVEAGRVVDSGKVLKTRSGRDAVAWKVSK